MNDKLSIYILELLNFLFSILFAKIFSSVYMYLAVFVFITLKFCDCFM